MTRWLVIYGALLASALPVRAHADALPLERTVRIGEPERAVVIRIDASEQGPAVTASSGGQRHSALLALRTASEATVELVEVARGHRVAIVHAAGGGATAAAVVAISGGRPSVVWTGRTDLHGDPGERVADVLSLEDRTGDGFGDVVVGVQREGAELCGDTGTLLAPRAFDPAHGTMRPVALRRVPDDGDEVSVTATRTSPGPSGPPLLRALRFVGASSSAGHADALAPPPRQLTDGDPSTFWAEGRGGSGAGEFVVARFDTRFPIRALAVTAATGAGRALGRPRSFWLVGDEAPRVRVTMPEDAGLHPGERYWIVLPEARRWRCVALVLDEAYAPPRARDAAVHTGLGEVEAYTDLDFGGGIDTLVAALVEGRDGGDEAARLLATLGAPAVSAVAASWDRLDTLGKRRAVRIFAEGARRGAEEAIAALGTAARDGAEEVRAPALEALGGLGPRAGAELAQLVREPAPGGDDAVRPLLRHAPSLAVPALLEALSTAGGTERPLVREGLGQALARADDEARRRFEAWAIADRPVAELASAALGLAAIPATRPLARTLLGAAAPRAERFEDRYRLVRAARQLESEPEIDAWLASLVTGAEEWMLRAEALEALHRRDSERRIEAARAALADAYPRVRVQAVRVLDHLDADDGALGRLAREDSWPMVREAAVTALWDRATQRDAVRQAVRDRSARVRQAAVRALARAGDRDAWPLVRARLADDDEWPAVTAAALEYLRSLCVSDANDVLVAVIRRGLAPSPWQPDVDVAALAVDVALALGGPAADEARRVEALENAPASIRAAARRRPARCRP